jgi:hypothetical protein
MIMSFNESTNSNELSAAQRTTFFCAWPWLSGFFAAPAFVHLVRALAGWQLSVAGVQISLRSSWVIVIVGGALSIVCAILGCKKIRS